MTEVKLRRYRLEDLSKMDDEQICRILIGLAKHMGVKRMPTAMEIREHYGTSAMNFLTRHGGLAMWAEKTHLAFKYPSLCWKCENSVPSLDGEYGCEWSMFGLDVPGWELFKATKKKAKCVKHCPKFVRTTGEEKREYTDDGFRSLGMEIIRVACQDYTDDLTKYLTLSRHCVTRWPLYRNKYRNIYGHTSSPDRRNRMYEELLKLQNFFMSSYADNLSDYNCVYLMREIEKEVMRKVGWHDENPFGR